MAAIEAHLAARRGSAAILSPRDFGLAREWHAAGLPLATVLVGIDRALDEAGERVASLGYCRRRVEELRASGVRPGVRPTPPAEGLPLADLRALLLGLSERLQALRPGPFACFEPPLRKIQEVRDLLAVAERPNWDYLRGKLREIDDDVAAACFEATSPEERDGFRDEARRAVERHRGRLDDAALDDAMLRFVVQRARERLGLPRVSLV